MNLSIEKMTEKNLLELEYNLQTEFDNFWSINMLKEEIKNENSYYLIARIDDEIVGLGGIKVILDEAELNYIVTKKNKRNLGIASKILDNLISFANNNNIKQITLEVNEKNINAIKLYQKYNFEKIGIRKKYYNNIDDAILMSKHI